MKLNKPKTWPEHWWRWRCRRGTLELDVVLDRFLSNHLKELTSDELLLLAQLIERTDTDLQGWLVNNEVPPQCFTELVLKIKSSR